MHEVVYIRMNPHVGILERIAERSRIHCLCCPGECTALFFFFSFFNVPAFHSLLSAGEGGKEMEGGVVGAASKDDGGKAVTRRV